MRFDKRLVGFLFVLIALAWAGDAFANTQPKEVKFQEPPVGLPLGVEVKTQRGIWESVKSLNQRGHEEQKANNHRNDQANARDATKINADAKGKEWQGAEQRRTGNQQAGTEVARKTETDTSYMLAMTLSAFYATRASEGNTGDEGVQSFGKFPSNLNRKRYGNGNTANDAYELALDLCNNKTLNKDAAENFKATGAFPSCQGDLEYGGCATNTSFLETAYKGIQVKKGEQTAKCVQAQKLVLDVGASIEAKKYAYNATSVHAMMQEEQKHIKNMYAKYNNAKVTKTIFALSDKEQSDLFIRVNTAEVARSAGLNLAALMVRDIPGAGMLRCYQNNMSVMNKGPDIYKHQCAQYKKQTGSECRYNPGMTPSGKGEAAQSGGALRKQTTEGASRGIASPSERNRLAMSGNGAVETAKNRAQQSGECSQAAEAVKETYQQVAQAFASPIFMAYINSLSKEQVAEAQRKSLERVNGYDVQLAMDIEEVFHKSAGVRMYAANDPAVQKKPEDLKVADVFDDVGVDVASLMPVNGSWQKFPIYAALLPTLNNQGQDPLTQFAYNKASQLSPAMRFVMNFDGREMNQYASASATQPSAQ